MTIRHLRTFVIVFQKESITKASEILHVLTELENVFLLQSKENGFTITRFILYLCLMRWRRRLRHGIIKEH